MFFWDWTYLLLIPGLILGIWAQAKVNGAYSKYSRVPSQLGRPASQVVGDLLRRNGNNAVEVTSVSGNLTDHYNPATETLALSQGVYGSTSIAALALPPMRRVTPCRKWRATRPCGCVLRWCPW